MPLLSLALFFGSIAHANPIPPDLGCRDLGPVLTVMQANHYGGQQVALTVGVRAADEFIKAIDPSHTLLLESDVERIRKRVATVPERLRQADCSPLEAAGRLVAARADRNVEVVKRELGPDFKIDENTALYLDPDKRGYARTEAERVDLVRRMVQFQISYLIDAGVSLAKAKDKVIHRYELAARRVHERVTGSKLPSVYAEAYALGLDPHSAYFSAADLSDFKVETELQLQGIGAALRSEDGFTIVDSIVPGGPADRQGILRPNDKIVAVAQEGEPPTDIIDMDLQDVVQMIRGPKGTKVTLSLLREGKKTQHIDITLVRDRIELKDRQAKLDIRTIHDGGRDVKVAVIDLPSFYGGKAPPGKPEPPDSARDVARLLKQARDQGAGALVLDLSRNGGGLLVDAIRIAGLFIDRGAVVATKSSDGTIEVLNDTDAGVAWSGPMVVLTSPISASAAEILSGALHDYHRALIVGGAEHTFGKGTVQQLLTLPRDLGAIKVTTGMFFLPSGRSTQRVGVPSDIVVPSVLGGLDLGEAKLDYALPTASIEPFRSETVNSNRPGQHWTPIDPSLLHALRERSKARQARDPAMKEIARKLEEMKKDDANDLVKLGDLHQDSEASTGGDDELASPTERLHDAWVMQAAQIAADLVVLQR